MDRNSEARWYFAESTDRSAFYDLFFQFCHQYHVDWATATEQEKAFVEEAARTAWEKLIVQRVRKRKTIEELFKDFDGEYEPENPDWGEPVGREVW